MYLTSHLATTLEVTLFSIHQQEFKAVSDYQFYLIQKGTIVLKVDGNRYILKKGDIFLAFPGKEYEFNYFTENLVQNIEISASFINGIIPSGSFIECNSSIGKKNDYLRLHDILLNIAGAFYSENNHSILCANLFELADCLSNNFILPAVTSSKNESEARINERCTEIINYINNNYHLPLTLQSLANRMFLSPQYLSKFIRTHLGIPFNKYLSNIRTQHAKQELLQTDHSITNIAFNNGFPNMAAFNKVFREAYGVAPSAYRNDQVKKNNIATKSNTPVSFPSKNDQVATSIAIQIDPSKKTFFKHTWSDTINIGVLSNALSQQLHDSFIEAQKKLHFKYIRFQNIFSEEIIHKLNGSLGFDFSKLNTIIDFFREVGGIPFIELSYKPPKNHADLTNPTNEILFQGEKDIEYYCSVFEAMLCHCINRYGKQYVSQWRFEIWAKHNELLEYLETPAEYMNKYMRFYKILKAYVPECVIGGPGFNTSGNIDIFVKFLYEFNRHRLPLNFISIYMYSYNAGFYPIESSDVSDQHYTLLSVEPDNYRKVYLRYKKTIRELLTANIPVFITEFNSLISCNNYIPHSAFQAAFICKNVLDLFQETPNIAYWLFADITSEFSYNPVQHIIGAGLIDNYGIPKPVYYSYELLSKLGNNLIAIGNNYILTSKSENTYQFLAYHYIHYSKNYCFNFQNPLSIENTYDIFNPGKTNILEVSLTQLPLGRYKITKYSLTRQNGSPLDQYLNILENGNTTPAELNYMLLNLQEGEAKYYKNTCIPKQEIFYADSYYDLSFTIELHAHEIYFFEFQRQL